MTNELRDYAAQLFSAFGGQQGVLVIQRPYLTLCNNDHRAALLLSQCVYWSDRTTNPDGWFAKSYVEWADELGLTEYEVRRAAKALSEIGLETKLKKFNGAPVVHYRIEKVKFSESILKKLQNPFSTNQSIDPVVSSESLTEITTETTTETQDLAPSGAPTDSHSESASPTLTDDLDAFMDDDPPALYPCTAADINALIATWWEWVPLRPVKRGKVVDATHHFGNKENRAYAENLIRRGVGPADMALFLGDIRFNADSRWKHLKQKEMTFSYAAAILEEWVQQDREENWYTEAEPRVTARKPGIVIRAEWTLDEMRTNPDLIVDVPKPYIDPHTAAAGEDEIGDDSGSDDAALLSELENMGIPL